LPHVVPLVEQLDRPLQDRPAAEVFIQLRSPLLPQGVGEARTEPGRGNDDGDHHGGRYAWRPRGAVGPPGSAPATLSLLMPAPSGPPRAPPGGVRLSSPHPPAGNPRVGAASRRWPPAGCSPRSEERRVGKDG